MAEPSSPQKQLQQRRSRAWAWMDEYRGLEGYKRMRGEVMESLLAEYPELRGKMEVYDLTAQDQKAEQQKGRKISRPLHGFSQ